MFWVVIMQCVKAGAECKRACFVDGCIVAPAQRIALLRQGPTGIHLLLTSWPALHRGVVDGFVDDLQSLVGGVVSHVGIELDLKRVKAAVDNSERLES